MTDMMLLVIAGKTLVSVGIDVAGEIVTAALRGVEERSINPWHLRMGELLRE